MAEAAALHVGSGPGGVSGARVQPAVLASICECYVRRAEGQARVIGTLLGAQGPDGSVDIRASYAVPHSEAADQVAVDIDFHRAMLELHHRVNAKEVIVGWYSTGLGVSGSDALIQDFYARETATPVHLTVDTGFTDDKATIKAYISTPLTLGERQLAAQFQEIPLDLRMVEAERIGFENLKRSVVEKLPNDLEGLESSIGRLLTMVDTVFTYVDDVVEGRIQPDNTIGRYLADTVAAIPQINNDSFDKLFNDSVQDLLLVLYLANLTRTQLAFADKLNTVAQTL